MVGLDVVDRLLGAPPGLASWRVADMANRKGILGTWLSSAVARGLVLSEAESAYLRRWEQRVETLHATGVELADRYQATVLKGPAIARFYPGGLLRQSGDVDLFAPDQEVLWSCVRDLVDRWGAVPQGVSILEGPEGVHVEEVYGCVTSSWERSASSRGRWPPPSSRHSAVVPDRPGSGTTVPGDGISIFR